MEIVKELKFSVLSSGSKANSLYISSGQTKILIDAGLSAKKTIERLNSIGVSEGDLDAIIITHEHDDHIRGVSVLSKLLDVPIYLTQACYLSSILSKTISLHKVLFFDPLVRFRINDLSLLPFPIYHDAVQPVGFRVSDNDKTLVLLTDTGTFEGEDLKYLYNCEALILETNHDIPTLWSCSYPWQVKQRIAGPVGHLSNESASKIVNAYNKYGGNVPKIICAAHISENSNSPDLANYALTSGWASKNRNSPSFYTAGTAAASDLFAL